MPKPKPPSSQPALVGEDVSLLSFEVLKERFEASGCERDSFALATAMYAKDFHKAMALLPLNFDVYRPTSTPVIPDGTTSPTPIEKIDPKRLDFNGENGTTSHEWASALVAAKKLKLEAGVSLSGEQVTQVIEGAQKIYHHTRKEEPICRPL